MLIVGRTDRRAMPAVRLSDRSAHRGSDSGGARSGNRLADLADRSRADLADGTAGARLLVRDDRRSLLHAPFGRTGLPGFGRAFPSIVAIDLLRVVANAAANFTPRCRAWGLGPLPLPDAGRHFHS